MHCKHMSLLCLLSALASCSTISKNTSSDWLLIDDFENSLSKWQSVDTQNETKPQVKNPQITVIQSEQANSSTNHYLLKKPAAESIVGNRKALSYTKLPQAVEVGQTYTFYMRINVAAFPNNHAFGLSNLTPELINKHSYDAFEPTLRVTDKTESNGLVNDGALMVKTDSGYSNIQNYTTKQSAKPLQTNTWYDVWYVVNNAAALEQGQQYDVYVKGGEFSKQTLVYKNAQFRMKREQPLIYFLANCNTGPIKKPYGNGGLRYDDLYMSKGTNLNNPML
ncbi:MULTISPECIES: hypothetical protein [unclassified Pseudoalteromonas]|uniref:hypothetical protein n=1 Tax=unclassified Pseudoalteromonas TaxID=194690 RepID=UPI0015F52C61|nr:MULTISPECIES: hypothetical protein [unclassified Pseudoalteromonas]MBA6411245.1 hypothetical protein [Pseudoalteromonas sp. 5Ae-yellow]MDN3390286.1 hypothetical protein [Pseudoalteromonas sp. APC 3691]